MSSTPYAPPQADVADATVPLNAAELTRSDHLRHEVQLKSVGLLYFLGALVVGIVVSTTVMTLVQLVADGAISPLRFLRPMGIYAGLFAGFVVMGYGYRTLRSWVRIPGTILAVLWVTRFPVGTLLGLYILYLMFCARGRTILSPDYRAILAATPHMKYRRTLGDWIAVGVLVAIVLGLGALVMIGMAQH